jgi:hypothetical protein
MNGIRKLMKKTILFVLAFVILSCTENEKNAEQEAALVTLSNKVDVDKAIADHKEKVETNISQIERLKLETFTPIADEYYGCGCSLYLTEQDKETGRFIYRDAGDIAMVILNGETLRMDYKGESNGIATYSNELVEIKVNKTSSVESTEMEETMDVEGVLTVTKGKDKLEKKFVVYCGC